MNSSLSIFAAIVLALPVPAFQEPQRKIAQPDPRVAAQRRLRMIDLHDLIAADAVLPDFEMPDWSARAERHPRRATSAAEGKAPAAAPAPKADEARLTARAVQWQAMLNTWIQPPLEAGADRLEMLANGVLLANLTQTGHEWLDAFLEQQRKPQGMLSTQVHILVGPKAATQLVVPAGKDRVFLGREELEHLIGLVRAQADIEVVSSSHISFFRTRNCTATYDSVAYVKDWTVETVEPRHRQIAVPEIGYAINGEAMLARGVWLGTDRIGLEVELQRSVLQHPIRSQVVRLELDGGQDVEVGLPTVDSQRLKTQLILQPGHSVAFRGPLADGEREIVVLLHADQVDRAEILEPHQHK
ncbi:MAG TPA: hypothetical protein VK843_21265 [Planctomycetota bacterium]|nr:hypothetical protein [Planctomycetota bacterium]